MKIEPGEIWPVYDDNDNRFGWTFSILINDVSLRHVNGFYYITEDAENAMRDFVAELRGELSIDPNSSRKG